MTIYIYERIGKFSNGSGPSADVACECTQTYRCIKQILNVMSVFLLVPLVKLEQLNL